ncbi:hypothetical protein LXL04_003389 [Taraxacum kok-saghyz]
MVFVEDIWRDNGTYMINKENIFLILKPRKIHGTLSSYEFQQRYTVSKNIGLFRGFSSGQYKVPRRINVKVECYDHLVIELESVPENPIEPRLLQIAEWGAKPLSLALSVNKHTVPHICAKEVLTPYSLTGWRVQSERDMLHSSRYLLRIRPFRVIRDPPSAV